MLASLAAPAGSFLAAGHTSWSPCSWSQHSLHVQAAPQLPITPQAYEPGFLHCAFWEGFCCTRHLKPSSLNGCTVCAGSCVAALSPSTPQALSMVSSLCLQVLPVASVERAVFYR